MQTSVPPYRALLILTGLLLFAACEQEQNVDDGTTLDVEPTGGAPVGIPTDAMPGTGGVPPVVIDEQNEQFEGPVCGDSKMVAGEDCDDGNAIDGDGCGALCLREPGYLCLVPGEACIAEICGDGSRTASELCDDGNLSDGDGCNSLCQVESGWVCPSAGTACMPRCGDSMLVGGERCDDGNVANGDGCSAACLVEPGWFDCPPTGAACQQAVCGNAVTEANEGCDDGNDVSGDGCNGTCLREPVFDVTGMAAAVCGDGAKTLGEDCDDGNLLDGDGCSATCTVESGFECPLQTEEPETVRLPVMFRDFDDTHPDFEYRTPGLELGIVGEVCTVDNVATCGTLDAEGKPVLNEAETFLSTHTAADFAQWYRDVDGLNLPFPDSLVLTRMVENGQTIYRFESDDFFPLDGLGFGDYGNTNHNYLFTTELHYFIQYSGGERLEFSGDDDVWIFVNRKLAVDIGGVHAVEDGSVILGDENGDGTVDATEEADVTDDRFGITKGNLYEIHLFHAERHTIWSNFKLTLSNFILSRSTCSPICGSGTLEPGEMCDDGLDRNTGEYGACAPDCSGREFCGDGVVQTDAGEACDDGVNLSPYNSDETGCSPGCVIPARCGDNVLDAEYGETCDLGPANGGENTGCDAQCRLVAIVR